MPDRAVGAGAGAVTIAGTADVPAVTFDRRLDVVLGANAALEAIVASSVFAVYVTSVRSGWVLLIMAVVWCYCGAVLVARHRNRRGRPTAAVVWAAAGFFPVALVCAVVASFSLPLVVIAALMPALLAVPYLSTRQLGAMSVAAFSLTSLVTVLATFLTVDVLEGRVSEGLVDAILILGVPAIAALLVLVAWQSHGVMTAAAEEVGRSERRLERARADEQRRVERRLEATVTGHLDRARRLVDAASRGLVDGDTAGIVDTTIDDAAGALREANAELRALAAGLHSAVLDGQGLAAALESLGTRRRVALESTVPDVRLPAEVERAVYQCVAAIVETIPPEAAGVRVSVRAARRDVAVTIDVRTAAGMRVAGLDEGAQLAVDRALALDGTATVPVSERDCVVVALTVPRREEHAGTRVV